MNKKSVKGFTLIELIAAIAILSIGLVGISFTFISSSALFKRERINLELVSNNQSIAQNLKAAGKDKVKEIITSIKAKDASSDACYIYFNNYAEIKSTIDGSIDFTVSKVDSSSKGYAECISNNTNSKKYGAMLEVQDVAVGSINYPSYKLYNIKITVWNFQEGQNSKSQATLYIGRW